MPGASLGGTRSRDRWWMIRSLAAATCIAIIATCLGCAAKPKTPAAPASLAPPRASTDIAYRRAVPAVAAAAQPATAPSSRDRPISATDALLVSVQWWALHEMSEGAGTPLAASARSIDSTGGGEPLLVSPRLTRAVRVLSASDAESLMARSAAQLRQSQAALPRDVTATLSLSSPSQTDAPRRVEIEATRQEKVELALAVEEPAGPARVPYRERAVLELPSSSDVNEPIALALAIPFSFTDGSPARWLVALVRVGPGSGPDHEQAVARCAAELKRQQDPASAWSSPTAAATQPADITGAMLVVLERLDRPDGDEARRALLFLGDATGATLASDVALVAEDATIAEIARAMLDRTRTLRPPVERESLGWIVQSATLAHLASLQSQDKLPAELASVLTRFAGEAGRNPGSLDDVVRQAKGRQDLEARLVAENYIYLEDTSPGVRVRAFDWLTVRGAAPSGFDPLGPPKDRRTALEKGTAKTIAVESAGTTGDRAVTAGSGGVP